MIFGGLEIVAGGYFAHKYHKNKLNKRRLEEEAQHRRNNTFSNKNPSTYPLQPCFQHEEDRPQHRPQSTAPPQYACYTSTPHQPRPQYQAHPRPQQPRPKPSHAQSFTIPRRPVPERKHEIIIQPSLQRADSMATLSRMPVANGYRPSNQAEPYPPPQRQTNDPLPMRASPYDNVAFSVSSPAFGAAPTSPPVSYAMAPEGGTVGIAVDNDWETYEHEAHHSAYAPTETSTQLGERAPPPPYAP